MLNVKEKPWFKPAKTKGIHQGCLCCGGTVTKLSMRTRMYNGFGGWSICKNGSMIFCDQSGEYETAPTILKFEKMAREEPEEEWTAELYLPLRGATYQRHGYNMWVLVDSNEGFA
jgi:hypothetical protein